MDFRNNFEYDTAYPFSNQLDLPTLSTAIENDGADDFFGNNSVLTDIKQETMSPFNQTLENESNGNSTSEYMTPMTNNFTSQYECGEDKENISKTPVNRQLVLGNDSPNGNLKVDTPDALSTSKVDSLNYAMKSMQLSGNKMSASARKSVKFHDKPVDKVHPMETRLDTVVNTPKIVLRSRSVIRKSQACFSPAPEPEKKNKELQHSASASENLDVNVTFEGLENQNSTIVQDQDSNDHKTSMCSKKQHEPEAPASSQSPKPPPNIRTVPFARPENVPLGPPTNQPKRKASSPHVTLPKTKRFVSMAEELYKFQKSTPDRFHTKPRASMKPPRASTVVLKTTVPQSPALVAKSRSRPFNYPTYEEKEAEELKEIQSQKVTALPFNPRVFKTPNLGKPIKKRPVTAIEPFHLTEVPKTERARTPAFNFSARPIPKGLLRGVTGLGEKLVPKLTDPVTPSFEQRRLAAAKHTAIVVAQQGDQKVIGQRTIFHFGTPNTSHRRTTEVAPFSFDGRDKQIQVKKEQKIKQILEEERKRAEFHANPIPRSVGGSALLLNNNAVLPSFPVMSMFLNDGYKTRRDNLIKAKKQEEEELLKKLAIFKARPATVVHARPFEPKKPELPPLEVEPFDFNTERRAKEWEEYERGRKAAEAELDVHRKQREEEEARKEAEERLRIRKDIVHRANPVPKIKPFTVKSSSKELTVPKTPFRQRDAE